MVTLISLLQYYKLKQPQSLFSECENDCFIAHTSLSNKHTPSKWGNVEQRDFVARKTYLKFLSSEQ